MKLKCIHFTTPVLIAGSQRNTIVLSYDKDFVLDMSEDFRFCIVSHRHFQSGEIDSQVIVLANNINRIELMGLFSAQDAEALAVGYRVVDAIVTKVEKVDSLVKARAAKAAKKTSAETIQ